MAAARTAVDAGFDGVELHGANGYLTHQFLATNTNLRTDGYGGSISVRIRFAVEVVAAVVEQVGPERTALRISPGAPINDIVEEEAQQLYTALVRELAPVPLAYLHIMEMLNRDLTRAARRMAERARASSSAVSSAHLG